MSKHISNYMVIQSIYEDPSLLFHFLSNESVVREHAITLNNNLCLHLIRGKEQTVVNLVRGNQEQVVVIGSFCNFQSVNDKIEWLINSMGYHVFNCVMKDLKIEKYLEPGYEFTEEDYNKLCKLIGKETIIQIKTKNWDKWCLGLVKTLKGKFIKGELLQNVKVEVI